MENVSEQKKCDSCGASACSGSCKGCNCPHHKAVPVFVILIALAFLLNAWGMITASILSVVWPILLAAIGFTKLTGSKCKCC